MHAHMGTRPTCMHAHFGSSGLSSCRDRRGTFGASQTCPIVRHQPPQLRPCSSRDRHRVLTLASSAVDEVYKSMSENREVTVTVATGTQLVQDACKRHGTAPTASAALGQVLMGALLLAAFREKKATMQVTFKGQGPLGELQAIATSEGQVKGRVTNPSADPPLNAVGKLNVGAAVGKGILAVVRNHPLMAQPYTGMLPIHSGEIAEDLAQYLADSEQQNCAALGLGVSIGRDAEVLSAGGFLLQVLPFASEETLTTLEANIAKFGAVSEKLQTGLTARQIASQLLGSLEAPEEGFALEPQYGPCEREDLEVRMKRAVAALGATELADIVAQEGKLEVTCDFCRESLVLDHEAIIRDLEASMAS